MPNDRLRYQVPNVARATYGLLVIMLLFVACRFVTVAYIEALRDDLKSGIRMDEIDPTADWTTKPTEDEEWKRLEITHRALEDDVNWWDVE